MSSVFNEHADHRHTCFGLFFFLLYHVIQNRTLDGFPRAQTKLIPSVVDPTFRGSCAQKLDGPEISQRWCLIVTLGNLTLARVGGMRLMETPMSFLNGLRTAGRIALIFCIVYWASFSNLLIKKAGSDQVTEI